MNLRGRTSLVRNDAFFCCATNDAAFRAESRNSVAAGDAPVELESAARCFSVAFRTRFRVGAARRR